MNLENHNKVETKYYTQKVTRNTSFTLKLPHQKLLCDFLTFGSELMKDEK